MNTEIKIKADITDFNNKLKKVRGTISNLNVDISKVTLGVSKLAKALKFTSGFSIGVGGASILVAERNFRKFESTLMQAFTLLPNANRQAFAQMKKDALEFSDIYGVPTQEVAEGMYQGLSAGIEGGKPLIDFLKVAQESAIAGGTDLRTAVDLFTNIANAYGQDTYKMQYLADVLFKGISMSKLTFEELGRYLYQVIPNAASLKLNIVDLVSAISALSATGTQTRVGATQFRQFLQELSKHGSQANMAFRSMNNNVSFQAYVREGGRLVDIIDSLRGAARKSGLDMANLFSSIESGNAAKTMDTFERFASLIDAVENENEGSQGLAFDKQASTLQKAFDRIYHSVANTFTRFGDVLEPAFKTLYRFTDELAKALREDIDWSGMSKSFERSWKILINIANHSTDDLATYLKANLKLALLEVYEYLVVKFNEAGSLLSSIFALDSDQFRDFKDAFVEVAKSFALRIVDAIREQMPKIVSLFNPLFSFIGASIETAIKSLDPTQDDNLDEIREEKTKRMGERGSEERRENIQSINNKIIEEGTEKYKDQLLPKYIERNSYAEKMISVDTDQQNFLENISDGVTQNLPKDIPAILKLALPDRDIEGVPLEYSYNMDAQRNLLDAKLGRASVNMDVINLAIEQYAQKLEKDISDILPSTAINESFFDVFPDKPDIKAGLTTEEFSGKDFLQIRDLLKNIEKDADFVEGFKKRTKRDFGRSVEIINKTLDDYEDQMLATLYDAQIGLGKVKDVDLNQINFATAYNEYFEKMQRNAELLQEYENREASKRTTARNAQQEASFQAIKKAYDGLVVEMGKINVAEIDPNDPVLVKLNETRTAIQTQVEAFNKQFGANIKLEDPQEADYGASNLVKSPPQDPYEIKPLFRQISADSKQRVGGGGGAFSFENVQEKLLNVNSSLKDAVEGLTEEIKNTLPFVFKDEGADSNQSFKNFKGIVPVSLPIDDASATRETDYTQQEVENIFNDIINTEENIEKNTDVNNSQNIKKTRSTSTQESDSVFTKTKKLDVEISASKTKADDESTQKVSKTSSAINLVKDVKSAVQSFISSKDEKGKSVETLLENIKSSARTFKEDVTQKRKVTSETNQSATVDKSTQENKKYDSFNIKTVGQVLMSSAKKAFTSNTSENTKKQSNESISVLGESIQKNNIVSNENIDDKVKTDANKVSIDTINAEVSEINISQKKDTTQRDTKDERVNKIENNSVNRALVDKSISSSTELNKQSDALSTDEQATTSKENKIKKIAKTISEATTLDQKEVRRQFKEKTGREYKDSTNEERNQFKRNMVDEQLRQARQEIQAYLSSEKKSSTIEKNTSVNAGIEESVLKSNSTQSSNSANTSEIINLVQEVAKKSVLDTKELSTAFKETIGKDFNSATSQEKQVFSKEAFLNNITKATQGIEEFFTKKETLESQKEQNDTSSKLSENAVVNKTEDIKNLAVNEKSATEKSESVNSQTKKVIETLKIVAESNIDLTNKKEVSIQSQLVSSTLLNKDINQIDKITSDESKNSSSVIKESQEKNNTQSTQGIAEFFSKKSTDESETKMQGIAEFFNKKTTDENQSKTATQGIAEVFSRKTTEESDTKKEESDRKTQSTQGIAEFFNKKNTESETNESSVKRTTQASQGIEKFFSQNTSEESETKTASQGIEKFFSQNTRDSEEITTGKIDKAISKTSTDSKESIFKASRIIGVVEDAMSQTSKAVSTKVNRVFTEKKELQSVTKDTPFSSDEKPKVNNTPAPEDAFKIKKKNIDDDSNTTINRVFKDVLDMNKTTIGLGRQQVDKQTNAMSVNDLQPLINALNSAGANINTASAGMANIASKSQQATIEDIYPTNF